MLGYGRDESVPYAWRNVRNQFRGGRGELRGVRHVIGRPSAAVGADLSRPHIREHPRNGGRICVFDNAKTPVR